jgi:hypothetical protein
MHDFKNVEKAVAEILFCGKRKEFVTELCNLIHNFPLVICAQMG